MRRLLFALVLGTGFTLMLSAGLSALWFPLTTSRIDLASGALFFEQRCSGCHATEPGQAGKMGPSLATIGVDAARRETGMHAEEYILESLLEPEAYRKPGVDGNMPRDTLASMSPDEIRSLIGWLTAHGAEPNYPALLSLPLEGLPFAAPDTPHVPIATLQQGWRLFNETLGCSGCHNVFAHPGGDRIAPALAGVSQLPNDYLRESIREPNAYIVPGYRQATVTMVTGEQITGRLVDQTEWAVALLFTDAQGELQRQYISRDDIETIDMSARSMMPAYRLSPEDESALVLMLKFLKGKA